MTAKKTNKKTDLEQKLEEEREARLRLAADYANFQKRVAEQEERIARNSTRSILEKISPVFDNFYRASAHAPNIDPDNPDTLNEDNLKRLGTYLAGLSMVAKQMEDTLKEIGLIKIATKGEKFDPNLHEAISYEETKDVPADYIIDEVESGWLIEGVVIRPAKVRVSKG